MGVPVGGRAHLVPHALARDVLPIPGTSSVEHLEEDFGPAGAPRLTDRRISALDRSGESRRSVNTGASVARFGPPAGRGGKLCWPGHREAAERRFACVKEA